jgi:hypothetical protein
MKKLYSILFLIFVFYSANAQVLSTDDMVKQSSGIKQSAAASSDSSNWQIKGMTGLNGSQTALFNWAAGGENSVSGNAFFNGGAYYRKSRSAWDNDLALEFGLIYSPTNAWRKNADKINFSSKYGYAINKKFFYTALIDFKTQFAPGYNYPNDSVMVSRFMAPGYLTAALGIEYVPVSVLSIFLSPTTGRFTFVCDENLSNAGAFGVKPGKKVLAQIGAYARISYNQNVTSNLNIISRLELFTPYDKSFGNVVVNWNTTINLKINKFISANLSTSLVYDDAVKTVDKNGVKHGPKIQFKEVLGIGFAYMF